MHTAGSTQIKPIAEFKRRFLLLIMVSGAIFTAIFEVGAVTGATPLTNAHFNANLAHICASTLLTLVLLERPEYVEGIAKAHAVNSFLIFLSALYNMPADEMRFLWFYVQAGGTFLLIGTTAGWLTIALSIGVVAVSRELGLVELSPNGMGTFGIGLPCAGAMFHAYNRQASRHIAAIESAYAMVDRAARHDGLTGLLNVTAFRAVVGDLAGKAERQPSPTSVLFIDVDRFKSINDRFGHAAGDRILTAVARSIRAVVRTHDVVARIGGEEVVVVLADTDQAGAWRVAEKIRAAVEALCPVVGDAPLTVTVSVGCATGLLPSDPIDDLVRAADEAMYRAKQGGRNRVECADPGYPFALSA